MSITIRSVGTMLCLALFSREASTPAVPRAEIDLSVRHVATLHTARAAHTATALLSGQVLVVGGMTDGGGSVSDVELFDPAGKTVQTLGSLATGRIDHTATLLADGRVLVAGGFNGEYLASVEIYEPATRRFRAAGSMLEGRSGQTATQMPDGKILFVGGVGRGWTFLRSAELYDPATGRSEAVGSLRLPRESHTATLLADGRVLIVGGHNGRRQEMVVHASAERYDPGTRRFEDAGSLTTARHKHDAVSLADGRVLVIGGADRTDRLYYATTEFYNPSTATFEQGPIMANRRYKIAGTTVRLPGGNVLVTAGAPVAELLDITTRTFHEVPGRFPAAFRFAAVAALRDGDVVITGGYSDQNRNTAGVWLFGER